jgi:uncharacterized protein involved in exopolysaccharide biosynthesis
MPEQSIEHDARQDEVAGFVQALVTLSRHWRTIAAASVGAGLLGLGVAFLIPSTYLSRTAFIPPQQQQTAGGAVLSQLGALASFGTASGAIKNSAEQYMTLVQSDTVADRIVDGFDLLKVYDVVYRFEARRELAENTRVSLGKKDGLITIEVLDRSPQRAADIANRYVEELRSLTSRLALTEAQQRRLLFEGQIKQTRDKLTAAQQALEASGFSQGALRADARASAEGYARLRAEAASAEVRLQALRRTLADTTPEVQQAIAVVSALRSQLARLSEPDTPGTAGADYISKFREFKYQETLFDLLARQYELARVDEAREGALIQVVDEAKPAERKHRPHRALIAAAAAAGAAVLFALGVLVRQAWRDAVSRPDIAAKLAELRSAP